jgi:hypothetical protein
MILVKGTRDEFKKPVSKFILSIEAFRSVPDDKLGTVFPPTPQSLARKGPPREFI